MFKKLITLISIAVILFSFSFVMAQECNEIPVTGLNGTYDLGWVEPNMDPNVREIHVIFPESFNPDNLRAEISAEYVWGVWDCMEGHGTPPPASMFLRIDHPSDEYGYWAASFQPTELNGDLPSLADFSFMGSLPHSWTDLAGQEVLVRLSMGAFTWPECSLKADFFCTVNSLNLICENIVSNDEQPWGTIKSMYR